MSANLTPEILLSAYAQGFFPMAQSSDDDAVHWYQPPMRGQLSIADLHISKSLKKAILKYDYDVRINTAFADVIAQCGLAREDAGGTWINAPIKDAFCALHHAGFAHSVEIWRDNALIGGLYGVSIGAAFCGESMFSRAPNASKIALVHLAARLHAAEYEILDTQYTNSHLQQFGVYEISHENYVRQLNKAMGTYCDFADIELNEQTLIARYLDFQKGRAQQ